MKLIAHPEEFENAAGRPTYGAIGTFDGLHLGHRYIIDYTVRQAAENGGLAFAVTFDRHPAEVIAPERAPTLIYPYGKRLELLKETALDLFWVIKFDRRFSRLDRSDFLANVCRHFRPLKMICVGTDFRFGYRRTGDIDFLRERSRDWGYAIPELAPVRLAGQIVSSTAIRDRIVQGDLAAAARLLGRPYAICGTIVAGKRLGRELGFPTANLDPGRLTLPPSGVYAAWVTTPEGRFRGVANIGKRPTVEADAAPNVEAHLLDFHGDLYERPIEIRPLRHLRPEMTFPSRAALQRQIQEDTVRAAAEFPETPVTGSANPLREKTEKLNY